jgi:PAS domain S-box-containing protein
MNLLSRFLTANSKQAPFWRRVLVILLLISLIAGFLQARRIALEHVELMLNSSKELLRSHLAELIDVNSMVPRVLSVQKTIRALAVQPTLVAAREVNEILEEMARTIHVNVIYLIDRSGNTLAASNWRTQDSFIGHNYKFRPYFQQAINGQDGHYIAKGVTSHNIGQYLSSPVTVEGEIQAVVVEKISFDSTQPELNELWRNDNEIALVTDENGVIVVSPLSPLTFKTFRPIQEAARKAIETSQQYGNEVPAISLTKDNALSEDIHLVSLKDIPDQSFLQKSYSFPNIGMGLSLLIPASHYWEIMAEYTTLFSLIFLSAFLTGLLFIKRFEYVLKHRLLFESSRDALMMLAPPSWKFTGANQAALQLFGVSSEEEFITLGPGDVSPERQPDGSLSSEKAQKRIAIAMRDGSHFFEWEHQRLDGQPFSVDVLLTLMEIGTEVFLQATVRDISARKQSEQAMCTSRRELKATYELLLQKNIQLEESEQARSEFLAAMSHELKTPLNSIIGFSELLKEGIAGPLTDEQRGFTLDIYTAGIKLLGLLSGILEFSRLEAGYARLELKAVAMDVMLAESVMPWRERAMTSGLTFTLDIPDALGTLWLDSVKVRQIVVSLLSNAIKFTSNGGIVTLTARRVAQVSMNVDNLPGPLAEYLEIEVCDTGIGFTTGLLPKLFEAFHQGDATLARHHQGIGLGLAMVKSLVDLHGGAVRAYNAPDHGACVTVWLPWREHAEEADVSLVKADLEIAPAAGYLLKQEL